MAGKVKVKGTKSTAKATPAKRGPGRPPKNSTKASTKNSAKSNGRGRPASTPDELTALQQRDLVAMLEAGEPVTASSIESTTIRMRVLEEMDLVSEYGIQETGQRGRPGILFKLTTSGRNKAKRFEKNGVTSERTVREYNRKSDSKATKKAGAKKGTTTKATGAKRGPGRPKGSTNKTTTKPAKRKVKVKS